MSHILLHHYDSSPFSEKMRLVLGFKGLSWTSVEAPKMLPKPDIIALTGGYRRIPILQIGADVYCDTALMCRLIEQLAPAPTLYPASATGLQHAVAHWADSALFWAVVPFTLQSGGGPFLMAGMTPDMLKAFAADRAAMTPNLKRATPIDARAQVTTALGWIESTLDDGRDYLMGPEVCIADFSVAQVLWFMHRAPPVWDEMTVSFARLRAWLDRILAIGHADFDEIDSAAAITIAATAQPHAPATVRAGLGFEAGVPVTVMATDYASDLVEGKLVGLSNDEVVIERIDPRAGIVHVHFPRIGYQIKTSAPRKDCP